MISPIRSRLARWSTTLIENAKPSSFTSAMAACFCLTELAPAIRSADAGSESCTETCTCSSPAARNASARFRVRPSPEVTSVV